MKKWHKRTLIVLTLGAVGVAALGMRPALLPDQSGMVHHFSTEAPLPEHLSQSNFSFTHTVNISEPQRGTWMDTQSAGIQQAITAEDWVIQVTCREGKLHVQTKAPEVTAGNGQLRVECSSGIGDKRVVRSPNGSLHTEYLLHISCFAEFTPTFWRPVQQNLWVQFITIDVEDEAADMSTPLWVTPDAAFTSRFRMSTTGPGAKLPARYCNGPLENAMLRLVRTLAACTPETHEFYVPTLTAGAGRLCRFATTAPWPDCWGQAAQTARALSYRLGPTLLYLEQNACFGNEQLIDFINGKDFATIFGENFADSKSNDLNSELQGIDIERINNL